MAIAFVTGAAANTTHGTSLLISAPASIVSGNLLIAIICNTYGGTETVTPPAGWTFYESDATTGQIAVYYKYATGSEPASYTWGNALDYNAGVILQYSGTATSSPLDVYAFNSGTQTLSFGRPTTTGANELLVLAAEGVFSSSITTPSGTTARNSSFNAGNQWVASFDIAQAVAGETAAYSTTCGAAETYGTNSVILAIKPGTAPAPSFAPLAQARPSFVPLVRASSW